MNQPTQPLDLDAIDAVVRNAAQLGADIDSATATALAAEVRRLRTELAAAREQGIADAAAWLHETGETNAAYLLRTVDVPPAEVSYVVADGSDDPEHVDDCPGCEAFTLTGHRAARPAAANEDGQQ